MADQPDLRWRDGRSSFALPTDRPLFQSDNYIVKPIGERDAKAFVQTHHYSGSYPAARFRAGLLERGSNRLVGVAVFSVPMTQRVLQKWFGDAPATELGRFVLLDEVGYNGETWFLGKAFALLRRRFPGLEGVLAYSDPVPRVTSEGVIVMPGHVGSIYQGHNALLAGTSSPRTLILDSQARVLSGRALTKIRKQERGWRYAEKQLVEAGAPPRGRGEDPTLYVKRALSEGPFKRVSHPGNWAYLWPIGRSRSDRSAMRRFLTERHLSSGPIPYPKKSRIDLASLRMNRGQMNCGCQGGGGQLNCGCRSGSANLLIDTFGST